MMRELRSVNHHSFFAKFHLLLNPIPVECKVDELLYFLLTILLRKIKYYVASDQTFDRYP